MTTNHDHQLNWCLAEEFTYQRTINDEASSKQADKCFISSHYCHNDRRRCKALSLMSTDKQSK